MKVTLNQLNENKINLFPKLMIATKQDIPDKGIIVLFTEKCKGFVVYTPNDYRPLGYSSTSFVMECFTDFDGSITLSND